jgi:hypothetical protein
MAAVPSAPAAPTERTGPTTDDAPLRRLAPRCEHLAWLLLAIVVGLVFAVRTSWPALSGPLVVHDDVRQHIFWVPRLHDPALFPNDPMADYYQAQSPPGVRAVYWLATLAVDAIVASKVLPLLLTVALAGAGFALGRVLWARDDAAALGAILLAWSAWQYDDVASATPRAFALPLLAAQFAALASGRLRLALGVLVATALFYPLSCAVMTVTTGLWLVWHGTKRGARAAVLDLLWLGAATVVAGLIILASQHDTSPFGPTVTAEQARTQSEFQPGGRSSYFIPDPYKFWIESTRSGLALAPEDAWLGGLPALTIPFLLAACLGGWLPLGRVGWAARPTIPHRGALLVAVLASSLLLFGAAHLLLFALYLPARHVQFTLPIVWALAGGLFWTLLGQRLTGRAGTAHLFVLGGVALLIVHAPPVGSFYVAGQHPAIYAYLRTTPPATRVAALPADSSILPLFGQRPVVASFEHALPYHRGYYEPLRARTRALQDPYYGSEVESLVAMIDEEHVGVIVANVEMLARSRRGERDRPALEGLLTRCGLLRERGLVVVAADCVRAAALSP